MIMSKVTLVFLLGLLTISCGLPTDKVSHNARIAGGSDASPGDAPYQVSLMTLISNYHFCSGALVKSRTIVTAANCLLRKVPSNTKVITGSVLLSTGGDCYTVSRLIMHPEYDASKHINDVGVVITSSAVHTGSNVAIIPMNTLDVGSGVSATLTGWGYTSTGVLDSPDNLQIVTVRTLDVSECKEAFDNRGEILDSNICTFGEEVGSCFGDGGAPLLVNGALTGVVSWSRHCGTNKPDVHTRISSYFNWINSNG